MRCFVFSILAMFVFVVAGCNSGTQSEAIDFSADKLRTPEEQLAGFEVADGFIIELVADERDGVINPIDITFDDAGRLWTQTAGMYPLDPVADAEWNDLLRLMDNVEEQKKHPSFQRILSLYQGNTRGTDKILVISDLYGTGEAKTAEFADSLAIPMSILPYKNGVYVAQGSELFFLEDNNHDGKADKRVPLFTGFGYVDTHTMTHALVRGPGDWIHFSHGALNKGEVKSLVSDDKLRLNYSKIGRFSLDAKKIELVSSGLNNIWGFQLRANGQWYATEANDLGYSIVPMEPGTGLPGIGNERLHPYQPFMPVLHTFRVGGTGISGLAFSEDVSGSFPDEWKNVALLANPITSTINAVRIIRNADGSVQAEHIADLLRSKDKFFRPVNMEFGPDGSLYIADWYDKIISHNEVPRNDPNRDKSFGRIWRIRHKSQKEITIPDFYKMKTDSLPAYLKSPSIWMKRSAWHQISDRPNEETSKLAAPLVSTAADKSLDQITRIHALWSLEGMDHYDSALISSLLQSPLDDIRREAIRSLITLDPGPEQLAQCVSNLIEDKNAMVRSQVLRTIYEVGDANTALIDILVRASKPELPGNEMGGSYERRFERYLALKAMERYPAQVQAYFNSTIPSERPAAALLWAAQALPPLQRDKKFLELWPGVKTERLDESTFIMISKLLPNPQIYNAVKPVFERTSNAVELVQYALQNQQQVQSDRLAVLLQHPVNALLQSNAESEKQIALDAVARMKVKVPGEEITKQLNETASTTTIRLALKAMGNEASKNKQSFVQVLLNDKYPNELRVTALHSLAKTDSASAAQHIERWFPELNNEQKKMIVDILSSSETGSRVLLNAYANNVIAAQNFSHSSAERIYNANLENKQARAIVDEARKKADLERKERMAKHSRYLAIVEEKKGDPSKGKIIFESTCLMCHKVGDKGQDIAPALDGSSSRSNDALLTALLNPDAAVESGYAIYQVTKKDNSTVEGYLFNKDERGTTIAFMGGNKVFVEAANIKEEGFLGGRSFMPKGLIDAYTEKQLSDLFAYIRTLK